MVWRAILLQPPLMFGVLDQILRVALGGRVQRVR